jgi:hypothetical protein
LLRSKKIDKIASLIISCGDRGMSINVTGIAKGKKEPEAEPAPSKRKTSPSGLFAAPDSIASAEVGRGEKASKKGKIQDPLTDREKEVFLAIFRKLSETSIVNLMFIKGELEELSKEVEDISPFNFLLFLRSEKSLQDYIKKLKKSSESSFNFLRGVLPYDRTIQDFSLKMEKEKEGNELKFFLETLSKELIERIEPMIKENRFKDFFELFLEN